MSKGWAGEVATAGKGTSPCRYRRSCALVIVGRPDERPSLTVEPANAPVADLALKQQMKANLAPGVSRARAGRKGRKLFSDELSPPS